MTFFTKTTLPTYILLGILLSTFFGMSASVYAQETIGTSQRKKTNQKQNAKTAISNSDTTHLAKKDTVVIKSGKAPAYRPKDRFTNRFIHRSLQTPLILKDPKSVKDIYKLDPTTNQIDITEKVGSSKDNKGLDFRPPQSLTKNEYDSLQYTQVRQNIIRDYENQQNGISATSGRGLHPLLEKGSGLDRLFGGNALSAKPNGFVTLDFIFLHSYRPDPTRPIAFWTTNTFDFKQHINTNLNTNIGNKMGFLFNFDTKAAFNFDNKLKLNFKNQPEDILQAVEAGNINFPLQTQLIPGVQNLFGVKAKMRFGKLDVTAVASQQRSRTQSIRLNGGVQSRPFEIRCDAYDENRHFFLSQFFRNNYEKALKKLPMILTDVHITRVEVYVTNRTNSVETMRNIVALTDLGEAKPFNNSAITGSNVDYADNSKSNNLYDNILNNDVKFRAVDNTSNFLSANLRLNAGDDYELLRGAKKLSDREFKFHPQLGYISLITPLRNDEILAVAYEYTYKGRNYKVGELTEDYASRKDNEVIMMKMIKSSTIRNKTNQPMWDLMMKNVYNINTTLVNKQGFQLRIIYKDDQTGMDSPNLQEGKNTRNSPLIKLFGLDNLNSQNDVAMDNSGNIIGDGNFDFVEDATIDAKLGKIFFPTLEPFGSNGIGKKFDTGEDDLRQKYDFDELYRSTISDAAQVTTKTKFFLKGSVQSSNAAEVQLPIGVTAQSVKVFSGGQELRSGTDFTVDQQLGRVKITNQSVLSSAQEIRIDYEQPDLFNTQIRTMFGTRLDYNLSRDIHFGGTFMSLRETPAASLTRVAVGNEPVNNTIIGTDVQYRKDSKWLTRLLDKIPGVQTKENSAIQFSGEYAQLFPGVSNRVSGNAMIDDFEAVRSIFDLSRQPTKWRLGSTPIDPTYDFNSAAKVGTDPYAYNYRRAKMSVYTIDQSFFLNGGVGGTDLTSLIGSENSTNIYERPFSVQDIFPGRSVPVAGLQLPQNILDISYFPSERGMYNYNTNLNTDGSLNTPEKNFGSVMRGLTMDNDFDNSNIEYVEFYMLDPFAGIVKDGIKNTSNSHGGKFLIQLGDVSEDVIPNNRYDFENGLHAGSVITDNDVTAWGNSPHAQYLTDAFDNQEDARKKQDVGLDGLNNSDEQNFGHIKDYLNTISTKVSPTALAAIKKDPSADDFEYVLSDPTPNKGLIERYKNFMGMENNSPIVTGATTNSAFIPANSATPDKEDINADNTINEVESYHEYEINLSKESMAVGKGYIIDKITSNNTTWYLFRIPVKQPTRSVGGITGFKSIRFMRMVMTNFQEPVVLRLASFQMVGNQYRTYTNKITNAGLTEVPEPYDAKFKVGTVSVEENGCADGTDCSKLKPDVTPYVVPPGFVRDRDFTQQSLVQFNEQSISLCVTGLKDGDSRAVFRNTKYDLLNYQRLQMFVHMENDKNESGKVGAFMRLGTDLTENYYEVVIDTLTATPNGNQIPDIIWSPNNNFDVDIHDLIQAKIERDSKGAALNTGYSIKAHSDFTNSSQPHVYYTITVVGRPDISSVQTIMLGVRNPKSPDGQEKSFCVWFDELRTHGFNEHGGYAATATANIKLADLGTLSLTGSIRTFGFGAVQDRISDRARDETQSYGIVSNLFLDKFLPEKWGLKIPFFINYNKQTIVPHYDPLNPDMSLDEALTSRANGLRSKGIDERIISRTIEDYRQLVIDQSIRKGFNLTNVRKIRKADAKQHLYDIENFSVSYAQNQTTKHNILIDDYSVNQYRGGINYQFAPKSKPWEPFKNTKSLERYWLKDFNINLMPSIISIKTDFDSYSARTQLRNSDLTTEGQVPTFEKYFKMNRYYDLQWNLTKSLTFNWGMMMNALVDVPYGDLTQQSQGILKDNILHFGRAKNVEHKAAAIYRLPFDKFFILDWIQADAKANTSFKYMASAMNLTDENGKSFGSTVSNSREWGVQGKIDLVKLYNKMKYLRFANSPTPQQKRQTRNPGDDENIEMQPSNFMKNFTRVLMTVRGINVTYSEQATTILPGFMKDTAATNSFAEFSQNLAPNRSFAWFGQQDYGLVTAPNSLRNQLVNKSWLSKSADQSQPIIQTRKKHLDFGINLEPFKSFRMQIKGFLDKGDNYQENLTYDPTTGTYTSLSPMRGGSFSTSFFSWNSFASIAAFQNFDSTAARGGYKTDNYDKFNDYRKHYFVDGLNHLYVGENTNHYSATSQDVLIPAFFAAYTGKNPADVMKDVAANKMPFVYPFLGFLPMPNWNIDYSGLAELYPFKKLFKSLSLRHSYSSIYSVGSFTSTDAYGTMLGFTQYLTLGSNVLYPSAFTGMNTPNRIQDQAAIVNANKEFIPVFAMSTISLTSKFAPLIGINFTTISNITGKFEYNQDRNVVLNLSNATLAETTNWDLTFGFGFKKKGVKLPFRAGNGSVITLKNDLNFQFQCSMRDTKVLVRKLDADSQPTQGEYYFQLHPSIQYELSKKVSMTFFVDRLVRNPFVSVLFPNSQTTANLQVKFNLAEL